MRVPWYYCVLICVVGFGITYWLGSRGYDFMTPPAGIADETEIQSDVKKVEEKGAESGEETIPAVVTADAVIESPVEHEEADSDLVEEVPSHPSDYLDITGGADAFVSKAEELIVKQMQQHSLVAWERVLDSATPTADQVKRAYTILKLHKEVNRHEVTGIAVDVKLRASVPADLYDKMERILAHSATVIERGSGYLVSVSTEVSVVTVTKGKPRPAVTVWFSGKYDTPRASFRTKSAGELGLDKKMHTHLLPIFILRSVPKTR